MKLAESIPNVQGPRHEIQLVNQAVSTWAVGTLGLAKGEGQKVADLVGGRLVGSYISHRKYGYYLAQMCKGAQFDDLLASYEDLDMDAHTGELTAKTLYQLAALPRYRSNSAILVPVLNASASDWDITFAGYHDFDTIPVPQTGSMIEVHPY